MENIFQEPLEKNSYRRDYDWFKKILTRAGFFSTIIADN